MKHKSELIEKAQNYVFTLFKEKLSPKFLYHNYKHTLETVNACLEIGNWYDIEKEKMEELLLAAWFHDTGYTRSYTGHEQKSAAIASEFLAANDYPDDRITEVTRLILSTAATVDPEGIREEILHDADYISIGKKSFFERAELLRIEWEVFLDRKYDDVEWAKLQLEFLLNKNFYTQYALKEYGGQRGKNIEAQRRRITKLRSGKEKESKAKSRTGRGVETMYRSTYRNHINLSAIADSKANMMISINTIIMSVIISLFGSGVTFVGRGYFEHLRFALPMCILLLTSLTSVVFAILSAKPTVTGKDKEAPPPDASKTSMLFFGNFTRVPIDDFVGRLSRLKSRPEELYDSMSIDIYYLGKVLDKKYRLLRYSYLIFMSGLILAVAVFMVVFIVSYRQVS